MASKERSGAKQHQVNEAQHGNVEWVVSVEEPLHRQAATTTIGVEQRNGERAAHEGIEDEGE